jgi:LPS O-antigen subunit length determinant protein (WzzB/FepE family)
VVRDFKKEVRPQKLEQEDLKKAEIQPELILELKKEIKELKEQLKQDIKPVQKAEWTEAPKINTMAEFNKTEDLFVEIWSHKWKIAIIIFVVAAVTGAATYMITPLYKSVSVVSPVNLYPTSDESTTEQLIQYFTSSDVKMQLAEKYKLFEYWGIDTLTDKNGRALFDYYYKDYISISPTMLESIEIIVKDHDRFKAQEINGGILALTNEHVKNNKKYILSQYITNIGKTINMQNRSIDSLIEVAKKDGVYMDVNGNDKDMKDDDGKGKNKKIKKLKQKEYSEKVKGLAKSYGRIVYKRDKFYNDYAGDITFFSIISHPTLTDKRCYPVRSMFIIVASLSTFLLCIVIILIRFRMRKKNA